MNAVHRTACLLFVAATCILSITGCRKPMMETVLPSVFGEDAVLGETKEERREVVYGHVAIDLPQAFKEIGTVDIMWAPPVKITGMKSPQYLTTTFYGHSKTYYLTQWTRLGTESVYFRSLDSVIVQRWNTLWQELEYVVPSNTANHEFLQYFDYLKKSGEPLAEKYAIKIYSRRFSGRVLVRVIEFSPTDSDGAAPRPFQELYPLQPYATVGAP